MENITRRLFLRNTAAAGAIGVSVSPAASEPSSDLQRFLDTASPPELAAYHANRLADAMGMMDKTRAYSTFIDRDRGFALVRGHAISGRPAPVAQVFLDDGSPLRADDVTGTTACSKWEQA